MNKRRTKVVCFRVSRDEYDVLKKVCMEHKIKGVSGLVRRVIANTKAVAEVGNIRY